MVPAGTATFTFFRINGATSMFAGTQTITEEVELSRSGDEFTAVGTSRVVNADGSTPPATCTTLVGVRRH
jgi:hypothetical protein